jgi:DMSO reductase anchor subunit
MAKSLDEVVVAYGKQTAKSIVGSVATIDSRYCLTTSYVMTALQGSVAGLILLLLEECQVKTLQFVFVEQVLSMLLQIL